MSTLSLLNTSNKRIVKKSNQLIRSRYDLSLTEQRIIMVAISFIDSPDNRTVEIPVSLYKQLLGFEYFNYKHLVDVLGKLRSNTIIMATENKKTGELEEALITGWVDKIHYENGTIKVTFNEDVWDNLVNLKEKYTTYQLSSILNLNSKYATRLYEMIKSYDFIGTCTMKVEEIRERLFLGTKYTRYPDFDKRIIQPSIVEINLMNEDNVYIEYEPIKKGVRYDAIKFTIKPKELDNSDIPPEVQMARSMSDMELFSSIKTLITLKYKCVFLPTDYNWINCEDYTNNALVSTYLSLMSDEWKDHSITSAKAFFAEHLKRMSN